MLNFNEDESVTLSDPHLLSDEAWEMIAGCANLTGYGIGNADVAKEVYSRLAHQSPNGKYRFNNDIAAVLRQKAGIGRTETSIDRNLSVSRAVAAYFGTTERMELAGFLDIEGNYLCLSGNGLTRDRDHRDVNEVLDRFGLMPDDPSKRYNAGLRQYMDMGNIRLCTRSFDISVCPNEVQWRRLPEYLKYIDGTEFYVDISAQGTAAHIATLGYAMYERGRMRSEIEEFFRTGLFPEGRRI